jgi:hypothetical protein
MTSKREPLMMPAHPDIVVAVVALAKACAQHQHALANVDEALQQAVVNQSVALQQQKRLIEQQVATIKKLEQQLGIDDEL